MSALSPYTGRLLPGTSSLAARAPAPSPVGLAPILRPAAAQRWLTPALSSLTPRAIEYILSGALAGNHVQQWELFDLMEDTWPRLAKNLHELKRAVTSRKLNVQPWQEEGLPPTAEAKERARLVSTALWRMRPAADADENGLEETLRDLLDAWAKGVSVLEIDWEIRRAGALGDITAPRCTGWAHPSQYAWHPDGWLGLRETGDRGRESGVRNQEISRFPEHKFLVAVCKSKSGHPLAGALLRPLAWWWCAQNFSADWLMNYAQLFGLPFRWANYDPASGPETVDRICAALEHMGSSGWAAFPAGVTLELKEAAKGGDAVPQAALIDRADKQCDLLILGQTLTTDVGDSGSRALGEVHEGVRSEVCEAACQFLCMVLNQQLVPSILRLNYGDDREPPELCLEPEKIEDEKANAERDQILLNAGVPLPKDWFYKRHNVPAPQAGEETITGRPPPAPYGAPASAGRERGLSQPAAARNEDEDEDEEGKQPPMKAAAQRPNLNAQLSTSLGVPETWLAPLATWLADLERAAGDGRLSPAQFLDFADQAARRLPELFGAMDHAALARLLEGSLGAAALQGVRQALSSSSSSSSSSAMP